MVMGSLSIWRLPSVGSRRPMMISSKVLLPLPVMPMKPMLLPFFIVKFRLLSTRGV